MRNIFIEGVQGSGKTTLLRALNERLDGYHMYVEGDISPIELSWCSYMREDEYQKALGEFPNFAREIEKHTLKEGTHYIVEYTRILTEFREFYQYMERYEIYNGRRAFADFKDIIFTRFKNFNGNGNLFECSFFQNIIEEFILYYCMEEEEIIDFYRELFEIVRHKEFFLIYIASDDIEGNILRIKKERSDENGVEMWYPLMQEYLNASPYGKKCKFLDISDMAAHFNVRMDLELRVIKEILGDRATVISSGDYDINKVIKRVL